MIHLYDGVLYSTKKVQMTDNTRWHGWCHRHKRLDTVWFHLCEILKQMKLIYCNRNQNYDDLLVGRTPVQGGTSGILPGGWEFATSWSGWLVTPANTNAKMNPIAYPRSLHFNHKSWRGTKQGSESPHPDCFIYSIPHSLKSSHLFWGLPDCPLLEAGQEVLVSYCYVPAPVLD